MFELQTGFAFGFGLLTALGPQNLFIIRQGIKREYAYLAALVCIVCDCVLIYIGGKGMGNVLTQYPLIQTVMILLGAGFLLYYAKLTFCSGLKRLRSRHIPSLTSEDSLMSWMQIALMSASFTFLNPLAVFDLFFIVGGSASQYPVDLQQAFLVGVMMSAACWFLLLTSVASFGSSFLRRPMVWTTLDFFGSGLTLYFAGCLLMGLRISLL